MLYQRAIIVIEKNIDSTCDALSNKLSISIDLSPHCARPDGRATKSSLGNLFIRPKTRSANMRSVQRRRRRWAVFLRQLVLSGWKQEYVRTLTYRAKGGLCQAGWQKSSTEILTARSWQGKCCQPTRSLYYFMRLLNI